MNSSKTMAVVPINNARRLVQTYVPPPWEGDLEKRREWWALLVLVVGSQDIAPDLRDTDGRSQGALMPRRALSWHHNSKCASLAHRVDEDMYYYAMGATVRVMRWSI